MKSKIAIPALIAVAIVGWGCAEQNPQSPELARNERGPSLSSTTTNTPVAGTITITGFEPIEIRVVGNVQHIIAVVSLTLTGDLVGTGTSELRQSMVLTELVGSAKGPFSFDVEWVGQGRSGTFAGNTASGGRADENVIFRFAGQGSGGLEGLTLRVIAQGPSGVGPFTYVGSILEPNS